MKVFLTGATGFIGSAIAKELIENGYTVLGLARNEAAEAKLISAGVTPYHGDMTDPQSLIEGAKQADAVINAGTAMQNPMDRGNIETNAVRVILEALHGTNKPFIYTSDQLIYGDTGNIIANEDTPLNPPPFIAWRVELEKEILNSVEQGVKAMIVRPVAVYGYNAGAMTMFIHAAKEQGAAYYVGDGTARWSVVHVADLARLYRLMLENSTAGTLLCASAEPSVSMKELMTAIGQAAGVPTRSVSLEEAKQGIQLVLPPDFFTQSLQISAEGARSTLGWKTQAPSVIEELTTLSIGVSAQ